MSETHGLGMVTEGEYTDENNEKSKYIMHVAKQGSLVVQPHGCSTLLYTFLIYKPL